MSVRDLLHARRENVGQVKNTYVFPPGVSEWTAPATTTALISAVGKGSDAATDYDYDAGATECARVSVDFFEPVPVETYGRTIARRTVISYVETYLSAFNAPESTQATAKYLASRSVYFHMNEHSVADGWHGDVIEAEGAPVSIWGQSYLSGTNPWIGEGIPENVVYVLLDGYIGDDVFHWQDTASVSIMSPHSIKRAIGYAGIATTGFGKSFAGGVYASGIGSPAPTNTFLAVAVTPSTTYTIINNGSLTIQYYS